MAISSKKKKEKMEEEIASNRERDLAVNGVPIICMSQVLQYRADHQRLFIVSTIILSSSLSFANAPSALCPQGYY